MNEDTLVVIADANVLLPLLFGQTRRGKFLRLAWRKQHFWLATTPAIIDELERVVTYPKVQSNFGLDDDAIAQAFAIMHSVSLNFPGDYTDVQVITVDPSDNIYLAAALGSGADYLVSQDRHILGLKYFYGTQIISLAQFVRLLGIE
ncbi:MAG TPA: putative toxin-antitoxin system toxin component, PIN family [Chloroflexi bacterium]|nr:putative toxin-antitoxin system toxin component, PIN family [Chloroflexota bacterium]